MSRKSVQLAINLFEAIDDENLSNIIILLEKHHADPNTIIPKLQIAPIHYISGYENIQFARKVAELFLKKNADPNIYSSCDSKLTALHIACIWGRSELVQLYLEHGGNLNLKCNEGLTPTLYAIYEEQIEVVDVIKKFIFEQKIEKKKNDLILKTQELSLSTPKKTSSDGYSTPIKNHLTNAIQSIEQKKFTPNRINYNFDVTSPYYINITHRRHKTARNCEQEKEEPDETCVEQKNLFELTEKNLREFTKQMGKVVVVERIGIHKRKSYIAEWREKIQEIRKDETLNYSYINYLNSCNNEAASNDTSSTDDTVVEIKSSSDSFVTADSDLKRAENAICDNLKKSEYIEHIEEDYIYSDPECGMVLYEKKIKSKDEEPLTDSSMSTVLTIPYSYDTNLLRSELTNFGHNPGPITSNTKRLYLKKLVRCKKYPEKHGIVQEENAITYPLELQRTITNYNTLEQNIDDYFKLEKKMVNHFLERSHIKWREGNAKTSFVYLLLDPRVTNNLPIQYKLMEKAKVWQTFLNAIFYVGKGKKSRPYDHLEKAIKVYSGESLNQVNRFGQNKVEESKKLNKIVDIWRNNCGVVCLHIFHNIMPAEAFCREASFIEALGIHNLTNMKKGEYYGACTAYTMRDKRRLGIALLYRALRIYLAEGESQLKPNDF